MKSFLRAIPAWTFTVILVGVISYLSLADKPFGETQISLFKGADKLAHALMYLVLDIVVMLDYSKHRYPHHTSDNIALALTAIVSLYGLLMELAQLLMNNERSYEIADWYADTFGAVLGFLLARTMLCRWYRHHILSHHHHHHHHHHDEDAENGK